MLIDLVPNHTSDRHPWFVEARSSRTSERRDWYVWADGGPDGSPPNNWRSSFGGSGVDLGRARRAVLPPQLPAAAAGPELVEPAASPTPSTTSCGSGSTEGSPGFRIDVAHALVKDRSPPGRHAGPRDGPSEHPPPRSALGLQHEPARGARRAPTVAHDRRPVRPGRVLLGETWVLDLESLGRFYGNGEDELHLALNVPFVFSTPGAEMREIVERTEAVLPHRRVAALERVEPRRRPVRRAAGATAMNDARRAALLTCSRSEARRSSITATRSGCGTSTSPATG